MIQSIVEMIRVPSNWIQIENMRRQIPFTDMLFVNLLSSVIRGILWNKDQNSYNSLHVNRLWWHLKSWLTIN